MLLLVTYDLRQPGRDYDELYEEIKNLGSWWWHYLDSTWIVKTSKNTDQASDSLTAVMDENDRLFVVEITGQDRQGWLPKKAWESLKAHE